MCIAPFLMQTQVHPRKDSIYVDGRSLPKNVESLYFCLNKPKGYMCSNDPNGKKLVVDLFEDFMSAWVRKPRARVSQFSCFLSSSPLQFCL